MIEINGQNAMGVTVSPEEKIIFRITGESLSSFEQFIFALSIYRNETRVLTTTDTLEGESLKKGVFEFTIEVPSNLLRPGIYSLGLGGRKNIHSDWLFGDALSDFYVKEEWNLTNQRFNAGIINIPFKGKRISR